MIVNPLKLKKTKSIDLDSKLKEYVIKNYDQASLTENVKKFFAEITQNRNVISKMGQTEESVDQIRQHINIITSYINQIIVIKSKMTFGKESYSCKIEFTWNDTLKDNNTSSYNIFFEQYNALFNLATLYFSLGYGIGNSEGADKNVRKEASKNFKYAMYLFNVIKEEANTKIFEKELPCDFEASHLDYCINLCEVYGNYQIYEIAKETSAKEFALQSKILLAVSEGLSKAHQLSEQLPTKKGVNDNIRNYFTNRSQFFKGMMCKTLRDASKKKFDDTGNGYGEIVFYQGLYVQSLLDCEETIKKCGKLTNPEEFQKLLEEEKSAGQEMLDLNQRIYHQMVPEPDSVKFETKNLMSPILPEDIYIRENAEKIKKDEKLICEDLELLIIKEVREMMNRYRVKINEIIQNNLNNLENESTISNFIDNLNLPRYLSAKPTNKGDDIGEAPKEFPPQLWDKISRVQQLGGTNGLSNIMQGIMNKSNYLIKNLENVLNSFANEERDDNMCRQKFRDKWIRKPSNVLNTSYIQAINQTINNLHQTKQFDIQENNQIMDNAKYFEGLMAPRAQLVAQIPKKNNAKINPSAEEKQLREQILKLYELSDKCMAVINPIFKDLNDDSLIVGLFIEVLAKKSTEQAIYERNKEEYEKKFDDLKKLSEEVRNLENSISQTAQKVASKGSQPTGDNMDEQVMNYFRQLDQNANMYLSKYEKIKKGDNYYNGLKQKIDTLIKNSNDWMIKRNDEKNAILATVQGNSAYAGGQGKKYLGQSAFMDPERNPYTHMNVSNINNQGNYGRQMGNNRGSQGQCGFGQNQGGFGGNQGGFGGNQGGFGGNQGGFGGNQGGF